MPLQRLTDWLKSQNQRFVVIQHSPAYTAQEVAESAHIPGRELAKTVVVKVDGKLAIAVTRAPNMVDTEALCQALGAQEVVPASEDEFAQRLQDCEPGAVPPFGHLYDMDVFISQQLARDERIWFNAGNHHELIQMSFEDYRQAANPILLNF